MWQFLSGVQEYNFFQIHCLSNDGTHNCSAQTNGTTFRLLIDNLDVGVNYKIQIAAATKQGLGRWSEMFEFGKILSYLFFYFWCV